MESKTGIETKLLKELKNKALVEWLVPLLLTTLLALVSFFGSNWISRIEKDNSSNTQQIKFINDKQINQDVKISNLEKGQVDLVKALDKLNYRIDLQNTDTRDIMSRTVRIETKLDFLTSKQKQDNNA